MQHRAARHAAPGRADSRSQETRETINRARAARAEGRTGDSLARPCKNQEATLDSFAKHHGFPRSGRTAVLIADHLPLPCAEDFSL